MEETNEPKNEDNIQKEENNNGNNGETKDMVIKKFDKLLKIGEGTYGVVYKARNNITGELVAIKKIKLESEYNGMPQSALREVSLLRDLHHPNIVFLIEVLLQHPKKISLVFEYLELDLRKFLDQVQVMQPGLIESYLHQILKGIYYCHTKKVLHRDLKPQNILLDKVGNLKIADFGLARTYCFQLRPYTREVVSIWYRSPELLLGSKVYSTPVDIWSIGCIFAEMLTRQPLFPGDSEIDQIFRIFRVLGTPTEEVWPGISNLSDYKHDFPVWKKQSLQFIGNNELAIDLIERMLVYDPSMRISARDALQHKYFSVKVETNK